MAKKTVKKAAKKIVAARKTVKKAAKKTQKAKTISGRSCGECQKPGVNSRTHPHHGG